MKSRVLGTIVATLVVALTGLLGWAVGPDDVATLWVVEQFLGLSPAAQAGILVAVAVALGVPWIAPYTPWTGDDWAIRYQSPVRTIFSAIWNAVAGNIGNAENAPSSRPRQ